MLGHLDAAYIEVEQEATWRGQWLDTGVALFLREHGLVPVARDRARPHQYHVVFVRDRLVEDEAMTRQAAKLLWDPPPGDAAG